MTTPAKPTKTRIKPRTDRRQSFKKALAETNRQYSGTLAKLAK
jgi:hypothetical protein